MTFDKGYPKVAYVGSCALIALVHNNKLYIANAGDSKAVLLRKND
jgi:serine/threonine protein phosphatase PrpC